MSAPVVYLSGPITGVKDYWKPFEEAEEKLASAGYAVINPAKLPEGMNTCQYMRINLAALLSADLVVVLSGSDASLGAEIEYRLASYCSIPVYSEGFIPKLVDERYMPFN